jgi:hypothetical protein
MRSSVNHLRLTAAAIAFILGIPAIAQQARPLTPVEIVEPLPLPISGTVDVRNTPDVNVVNVPTVALSSDSTVQVVNSAGQALLVQEVSTGSDPLPADILPPGGRTIGGPGHAQALRFQTPINIWFSHLGADSFVCVTVVNTAQRPLELEFVGSSAPLITIGIDEQQTGCGIVPDFGRARLRCPGGPSADCNGVWRVDLHSFTEQR